jgi:hypothetical protein
MVSARNSENFTFFVGGMKKKLVKDQRLKSQESHPANRRSRVSPHSKAAPSAQS